MLQNWCFKQNIDTELKDLTPINQTGYILLLLPLDNHLSQSHLASLAQTIFSFQKIASLLKQQHHLLLGQKMDSTVN